MKIEGRNAVREALRSGIKVERASMLQGIRPGGGITEIQDYLAAQGVKVQYVQRQELDKKSEHGAHQGIIIWTAPFEYTSLNALIKQAAPAPAPAPSLIVVLDHITDPGNLGAIARSAEVIGATGLIVAKDRAAAITPAAHKAAAGAFAYLPVTQVTNIARALEELQKAGFWVAGASEHAQQEVWGSSPKADSGEAGKTGKASKASKASASPLAGNIALVMGAEGSGLSRLVRERCDFLVKLPQQGKVQSLNVAQAATVLMYEWLRQNQDR